METIMAAEQSQDSKANIKVEKQPNGQVRVVIEGLSIAGNMMDVEEGVLQYLNQASSVTGRDLSRVISPLASRPFRRGRASVRGRRETAT
jgi:hypothetical protein